MCKLPMMQIGAWLAVCKLTHGAMPSDKHFIYILHKCFPESSCCYKLIQSTASAGKTTIQNWYLSCIHKIKWLDFRLVALPSKIFTLEATTRSFNTEENKTNRNPFDILSSSLNKDYLICTC